MSLAQTSDAHVLAAGAGSSCSLGTPTRVHTHTPDPPASPFWLRDHHVEGRYGNVTPRLQDWRCKSGAVLSMYYPGQRIKERTGPLGEVSWPFWMMPHSSSRISQQSTLHQAPARQRHSFFLEPPSDSGGSRTRCSTRCIFPPRSRRRNFRGVRRYLVGTSLQSTF